MTGGVVLNASGTGPDDDRQWCSVVPRRERGITFDLVR